MQKFREWLRENDLDESYYINLNESPVAVIGDWDGFKDNKSIHIAKRGFDKGLYEIIGESTYDNKKIYVCREKRLPDLYFFGVFGKETEPSGREKEVFIAFAQLKTIKRDDLKQMGYKNPLQTSKVEVFNTRLRGIGKSFYRWFIMNKYTLISDMIHFDGARKLWDSLSRDTDLICDVIDDQERKVIKHDTRVDSGEEDWDFDTDIWDYSFNKAHIRIALYLK